jgi:hypothetical protein
LGRDELIERLSRVELYHAAPVRLPPGLESGVEVAALALLEVVRRDRDVRSVMARSEEAGSSVEEARRLCGRAGR